MISIEQFASVAPGCTIDCMVTSVCLLLNVENHNSYETGHQFSLVYVQSNTILIVFDCLVLYNVV